MIPVGALQLGSILAELMCRAFTQHVTLDHVDVSGVDGGCQHLDVDITVPQPGHFQILQSEQGDTKEKGSNTSLVMYHLHSPPKLTAPYAPSH